MINRGWKGENSMVEELKRMVGMDETILYEGKPDKKCFIFESIFNPLLPAAIIWAIFDAGFLGVVVKHFCNTYG